MSIESKSLLWSKRVQLWALHKQSSINVKLTEQEKLFEVRFSFNHRKSQGYFFRYGAFFPQQNVLYLKSEPAQCLVTKPV